MLNFVNAACDLADKLKNVLIDLKTLRDVVYKDVVKNTKYNKLNLKITGLESKIPNPTTLIYITQYNTDK